MLVIRSSGWIGLVAFPMRGRGVRGAIIRNNWRSAHLLAVFRKGC